MLARAILSAQLTGGWTPVANDLITRSFAAVARKIEWDADENKVIVGSSAFKDTWQLGFLVRDSSEFSLGIERMVLPDAAYPTLAFVPENSLAAKLGLRTGDRITWVAGTEKKGFPSLREFKTIIREHAGGGLCVQVEREGHLVELQMVIPAELPQE